MLSRPRRASLLTALLISSAAVAACEKVPLLAPSGSTLTLTASATALPLNGSTQLIAQVIEPSGTPPHSGTTVSFTTTLGSVEPADATTDSAGRAVVTFKAGTTNGTATILAISGGVSSAGGNNAVKIALGTAAVGRVVVAASPTLIPALGGVSTITATVLDINGNALSSAPVTFSTTAGTVSPLLATTDAGGVASTTLQASTQATVTASVGAQGTATSNPGTTGTGTTGTGTTGTTTSTAGSTTGQASGTVTVGVAAAPSVVITPPTTLPSVGLPAAFTFAVTLSTAAGSNPSAVKSFVVNWGDGSSQDLGGVSGSNVVSHVYHSAGVFTITATATDASGNVVTVMSSVTVISAALTLTITAPASAPSAGLPANFTIVPGVPANTGDSVRSVDVNWGDNSPTVTLGAISGSTIVTHVYTSAGNYAVTGTITDVVGNTLTVYTAITVIPVPRPTIIITPSPVPGHVNTQTTLTIQVIVPNGISVTSLTVDFGDGQSAALGGATSAAVPHVYTLQQTYTVTVTVVDTSGQTTIGTVAVSIGP